MPLPNLATQLSPRGRRTADQPDGRSALLREATLAFSRQSFEAAGLRAIASAAGVSPNLVAVHFKDKAGLWAACVTELTAQMRLSLDVFENLSGDESLPLAAKLHAMLDLTSQYYLQNPATNGFILQALSGNPSRGEVLMESLLSPVFDASRPLIEDGIAAGLVRARSPAIVVAIIHLTLGHADHFIQMMRVIDPDTPDDACLTDLRQTLGTLLLIELRND